MKTLTLQDDEADNLEACIDALLADVESKIIQNGNVRRSLRRVSMKLHWAKQATAQTFAKPKSEREAA